MRSGGSRDRRWTGWWCASVLAVVAATSCTEPQTRIQTRLSVRIEADSEVRAQVVEVEAVVEHQRSGEQDWRVVDSRHFEPRSTRDWPYSFETDPDPQAERSSKSLMYQLTARARDSRGAVLAQARVVTTFELARRDGLYVLFDRSCLERTAVCGPGQTCMGGECVSAMYDPDAKPRPPAETPAGDAGPSNEPNAPSQDGIAKEGESCSMEGERRCASFASSLPLRCSEGSWQRQTECTAAQRCDTSEGPMRGTCRTMAPKCAGQQPNEPFCDETAMRVCNADLLAVVDRVCGDNEQCVTEGGRAECGCQTGFVKQHAGCRKSTTCSDNGGCDPHTACNESGGNRTCTACPAGFSGTGETGCAPLLASLESTAGKLDPPFSPATHEYKIAVPLLVQRLKLTATTQADAQLKINGSPVANGDAWNSPVLTLGANNVVIQVATESSVNSYALTIERGGAQNAYIKASNSKSGHVFGTFMAVSGDTLVIGAPGEDSAASGVNGDQNDTGARESGAAYVFVRSEDGWQQQAYLKPRNTASEDFFGFGVAVSGDTIAVGAMRRDVSNTANLASKSGSVYVYTRSNGAWSLQQDFGASDASVGDTFGYSVALDGDTLVAGAPLQGPLGSKFGAAYVFTRSGSTWKEQQKIAAPEPRDLNLFGSVISIRGDALAISAHEDGANAYRGGAVFVFTRRSGRFGDPQRLEPQPPAEGALFGFSHSIAGDRLAIGAPQADFDDRTNEPSGKVWVYQRTGSQWAQSEIVTAPLDQPANFFGTGVSLGSGALLVGAMGENGSSRGIGGDQSQRDARASGAAYLYALTDEGWKYSTYLKASNPTTRDNFGWMVGLTENFAVAVAQLEDGSGQGINPTVEDDASENSGAAYVFE
jgi:trimeric autotransporter adhesin